MEVIHCHITVYYLVLKNKYVILDSIKHIMIYKFIGSVYMNAEIVISVVMSVYNTKEKYLRNAINSILIQTYSKFEFIIINDGSNEETTNIINSYNDPRIVIINNSYNLGLTKSLNIGFKNSRGKYIARMDADDISLPERLYRQFIFMESNQHIQVLGTYTRGINSNRVDSKHWNGDKSTMSIRLLFYNAGFAHPTAFFRKSFLEQYDIYYDESIKKSQDYFMWVEVNRYGNMDILPMVLLEYRIHKNQISVKSNLEQNYYSDVIKLRQLNSIQDKFSVEDRNLFCRLYEGSFEADIREVKRLLFNIIHTNNIKKIYNERLFNIEITRIWVCICVKRIKTMHKFDMLFDLFILRVFIPSHFIHLLHYIALENAQMRSFIFKIKNKISLYFTN